MGRKMCENRCSCGRVPRKKWLGYGARAVAVLLCIAVLPAGVLAQDVAITDGKITASVTLGGETLLITRNQDSEAILTGEFARTSRACPPYCIQPMQVVRSVATIAELEVIAFLETEVSTGKGLLIDARLPELFSTGSIPGAVNVPFATLAAENPYQMDILAVLGGKPVAGGGIDFEAAVDLVIFCNGPWSDQSAQAVRSLREAGYPADKLRYYRGGLQDWQMLGLTMTAATTELAGIQTAGVTP